MVKTNILKYTQLQTEIFRLLCQKAGEKINQRQLANQLGVTSRAIAMSLPLLIKQELITYTKSETMNLVQIQFNNSNAKAVHLKRVENLRRIYESDLLYELDKLFAGATIILFGSYSRGEDTIKSDIDIAIIGVKEKKLDKSKIENELKRQIHVSFYDSLEKVKKELKENICNGIVLSGGIAL